jgi:hypothetical protein
LAIDVIGNYLQKEKKAKKTGSSAVLIASMILEIIVHLKV